MTGAMKRIDAEKHPPEWLASWLYTTEGEAANPYAPGTDKHARFAKTLEQLIYEQELHNAFDHPETLCK